VLAEIAPRLAPIAAKAHRRRILPTTLFVRPPLAATFDTVMSNLLDC
jgi:hypothetical protein